MIKFIAIFLSVFYNVVSIGATLQVHTCGSTILWSISGDEDIHDTCPLCHSVPADTCPGGDCQDIELKLDQLSDKLFSHNKDVVQLVHTAIITLPSWFQGLSTAIHPQNLIPKRTILASTNLSPPTYLLHCTFRI
ncbi:MAG TPA: hypothetical protein PKA53_04410 [Sphingobacterium sp.]|nr:hypothetical protein [Sphingobacterium sp.]